MAEIDSKANNHPASGKLVLVIDDDETALNLMSRRLAQRGYRTVTATNGDDGLTVARAVRPDIILLDIFMPGKNGYEVLDEIRADDDIRLTPVVVTTVDDDRLRGLRLGATDYLMKPVCQDELAKLLSIYHERLEGEVLVIDQDREANSSMVRAAAQLGLTARCAFDGAEGLQLMRDVRPAAIILDLASLGLDALALLDVMKSEAALAGIPVIILSPRALSLSEHEAMTKAACAYFTKNDLSPRQIAQTLKTALAA